MEFETFNRSKSMQNLPTFGDLMHRFSRDFARRFLPLLAVLFVFVILGACASPRDGAASNSTVTSPLANNSSPIGGDQRQATAAETGSASSSANPVIINAFGAKTMKVNVEGEKTTVELEGNPESSIELGAAKFGNQTFGNENTQSASVSSGSETGNK